MNKFALPVSDAAKTASTPASGPFTFPVLRTFWGPLVASPGVRYSEPRDTSGLCESPGFGVPQPGAYFPIFRAEPIFLAALSGRRLSRQRTKGNPAGAADQPLLCHHGRLLIEWHGDRARYDRSCGCRQRCGKRGHSKHLSAFSPPRCALLSFPCCSCGSHCSSDLLL
jgi:hypothetical protein